MSCLKIVPGPYLNTDALDRVIDGYVFCKAKLIGGLSVDPIHAVEQMRMVKRLWFQTDGCQLRHFVLCFNDCECDHIHGAGSLQAGAYEVCEYYAGEYQIVFGIHHPGNGRWDIHFVMNNVSFRTGKRYRSHRILDYDLKDHILTCLFPIDYISVCYD